jgi:lysophospholipase L1-like esterase
MKRLFGKLFLMVGGVIAALLIAEGVVRLGDDVPAIPENSKIIWGHWGTNSSYLLDLYNQFAVYDPDLGLISRRLLEDEKVFPTRPGFRIVLLGDSITMDGAYSGKLINALRVTYPERQLNFLTAGVAGWDTAQEYKYLRSRISDLKPDWVLVQFCINDFARTPVIWRDADGRFLAYNAGRWGDILKPRLMSHSRLARKILYALLQRFPQEPENDVAKVKAALQGLRRLSETYSFTFRFILVPALGAGPEHGEAYIRGLIRKVVADLNMQNQTIDLMGLVDKYDTRQWRRSPMDVIHPNDDGAKIMAEEIVQVLPRLPAN